MQFGSHLKVSTRGTAHICGEIWDDKCIPWSFCVCAQVFVHVICYVFVRVEVQGNSARISSQPCGFRDQT